jgi:hypothetical protein
MPATGWASSPWSAAGSPTPAAALDLAIQVHDAYEQARAHAGLAAAIRAGDDPGSARDHWQRAQDLYSSLGAPEASPI